MTPKFSPEMYAGPKEFVHSHNHTLHSALDGVASADQYAERCRVFGHPAMAITEHGHMGSVPDVYFAFKKNKVKPIFGCEIYYCDWELKRHELEKNGIKVRSPQWRKDNPELAARITRARHLTVLAKNRTGFENLIKLTTQAYETGLFGLGVRQFNRIWFEKLCEFKEGLIILSGCLNGPVSHELRTKFLKTKEGEIIKEYSDSERIKAAAKYVKKFKGVFGDDYKIELQMPGIEGDDFVFHREIELANHYKIDTVLANDAHYVDRKDHRLQTIMMAIAQETTVDSPDLFHVNSDEQFMKTRAELWATFKNGTLYQPPTPKKKDGESDEPTKPVPIPCRYNQGGVTDRDFELMCDNTLKIADQIESFDFDSDPKTPYIPQADEQLKRIVAIRLCELGLDKEEKRFIVDGKSVTYVDQVKIELKRFIDKGFSSYFLITRDLIKFGRSKGWPFSPRGSAGGSLVCHLLGIHAIDPLPWGLSFDRFLSPARGGYMLNLQMGQAI